MSQTAVVILNYNGEKLLRQFLPSVVRNTLTAEIIVADNGSTDQSVPILRDEFPSVTVIQLDQNYGFCGGYNRALKQVSADYYVLLNSDVEVTPEWLIPLQQLLDRDEAVGAVQPKILSYNEKGLFEYAGAGGGMIDALGYPFCRGRIFSTVEEDKGQYNDECQVFWATGACLVIRSALYHRFGGLDEEFFAHMEEIDLCWKLQRAGSKVYYCGKSTIYHLGAGTLGYANPRKTYLNFRNGLSLIFKHFDDTELLYKLPLRFTLDWLAAALFISRGEPAHMKAVFRAHVDFLKTLGNNRSKRHVLRAAYPDYSRAAIFPGLILLNYFVKGRKTWASYLNSPR
jgi:GT2 family glycosyltransferase